MYIAKAIEEKTSDTLEQKRLQRRANRIARASGRGIATHVVFGTTDDVVDYVRYGYRKYTTGEYVPKSYLSNFGWKNTYYQHAQTTVCMRDESN